MREVSRLTGIIIICYLMIAIFMAVLIIIFPVGAIISGSVILFFLIIRILEETFKDISNIIERRLK